MWSCVWQLFIKEFYDDDDDAIVSLVFSFLGLEIVGDNHFSLWRMDSATPELRLPSQS